MTLDTADCALIATVLPIFVLALVIEYRVKLSMGRATSAFERSYVVVIICLGSGTTLGAVSAHIDGGTDSGVFYFGVLCIVAITTMGMAGASLLPEFGRGEDERQE